MSVHPRSRGEHDRARAGDGGASGSSPLARGTRLRAIPLRGAGRFIPARAGNTYTLATVLAPINGSSPLARGTLSLDYPCSGPLRFIPARAGNTASSSSWVRRETVHPRSRGEHSSSSTPPPTRAGSSPLARGTRSPVSETRSPDRFIPARAGNTVSRLQFPRPQAVHPRSRGEHIWGNSSIGSQNRFIPARAGNTLIRSSSLPKVSGSSPLARGTRGWPRSAVAPSSVHPRSRGEHARGSTPAGASRRFIPARAGNTGRSVIGMESCHRFIPARAGNTCEPQPMDYPSAVHPRSRGEHVDLGVIRHPVDGSSPLARGTRRGRATPTPELRFIPARAGNTRSSGRR